MKITDRWNYHGALSYDIESGRFAVGRHKLHCGETIQLVIDKCWVEFRVEQDHSEIGPWQYYLIPNGGYLMDHLAELARMED